MPARLRMRMRMWMHLPRQQGLPLHCATLRVRGPFEQPAHGCGTAALRHNGRLQFLCCPALDRGSHGLAFGGRIQNGQCRCTVMGRIGMQANPAVRRAVVAGHGIPQRGHLPALRMQAMAKPQGGKPAIHHHTRRCSVELRDQLG